MAINRLPDLAERIQIALLNVAGGRDVQVRGYSRLRLPLDLLVTTALNPRAHHHPLQDRFGAVRTRYPLRLAEKVAVMRQERAWAPGRRTVDSDDHRPHRPAAVVVPIFMAEVLAAFTRALRALRQRSGVSVRFSTGNYETLAASALHRAVRTGEDTAVAR